MKTRKTWCKYILVLFGVNLLGVNTYGCIYNLDRICALSAQEGKEVYGYNSSLLSPLVKMTQMLGFFHELINTSALFSVYMPFADAL